MGCPSCRALTVCSSVPCEKGSPNHGASLLNEHIKLFSNECKLTMIPKTVQQKTIYSLAGKHCSGLGKLNNR